MLQNASEKSMIFGEFPQQEFFVSSTPSILIENLFEIQSSSKWGEGHSVFSFCTNAKCSKWTGLCPCNQILTILLHTDINMDPQPGSYG